MLTGVVWFIVTCTATLLAQTIEQFTLLRFLQDQPVLYRRGGLCGDTGVL